MSDIYHLDYETRSRADLPEVGTWRYAMDPSTEILCAAISKNDGPVLVWIPPRFEFEGDLGLIAPVKSDDGALDLLLEMLKGDGPVYAHNAMFEIALTERVLGRGVWPTPNRKRWRCTAAMARRANIPASLEMSAAALRVGDQKDKGGKRLISLFSVPQKKLDGAFTDPQSKPVEWGQFVEYCKQDVRAEKAVHKALEKFELTGWLLDTFHEDIEINARGLPVNLKSLAQARVIIDAEEAVALAEFTRLTGGIGINQRAVFKAWLEANGLPLANMQAATVDALIDSGELEGTGVAGEALQLKRKVAYAAIQKVKAMQLCAGPHDSMVRGSQQFYGAQATGRWSGRGIQPHNFKRPEFDETQEAYADLQAGASKEMLELWYGRPIFSILASCIRHFIHDDKGPMISGDYSAIEACVLAWLAGEQWKIDVFNSDGRIYEAAGCRMFGLMMQDFDDHLKQTGKTHPMRQKAKSGELACIAEGQLVTTDQGLVPIEKVTPDMRVWDGISFVSHGGVVYQGIKEVMTYENLTATKDHVIFTDAGALQFSHAAESGTHLHKTGASGGAAWLGGGDLATTNIHKAALAVALCADPVSGVWARVMAKLQQLKQGVIQRVSTLLSSKTASGMALQEGNVHEKSLRKHIRCWLSQLRGARHRVPVQVGYSSMRLDSSEPWTAPQAGAGSHSQRWALRTRQPAIREPLDAEPKRSPVQAQRGAVCVGGASESVHVSHERQTAQGAGQQGQSGSVSKDCRETPMPELEGHSPEVKRSRVYDILNCGPNNRFAVSGVLVHNCGYQGGVGALSKMCEQQRVHIPPEDMQGIVDAWREANPNIESFWWDCQRAVKNAIRFPNKKFVVRNVSFFTTYAAGAKYLFTVLPSGRRLAYRDPKIEVETIRTYTEDGDDVDVWGEKLWTEKTREHIYYWGNVRGNLWDWVSLYGGKIVENITQAVAFDLMANGVLKVSAAGFPIYLLIHDEILSGFDPAKHSLEAFQAAMLDAPAWAAGLPLKAKCELVPFYMK